MGEKEHEAPYDLKDCQDSGSNDIRRCSTKITAFEGETTSDFSEVKGLGSAVYDGVFN
jgi:hypothetical protein